MTADPPPASVALAAPVWPTVLAAADAADPNECCGLLLGEATRVALAWPAKNIASRPHARYEVDPHDHLAAIRHARATGLAVVGAYHSHPRTEPAPSPTDHEEAIPDFLYLIAGRASGAPWRPRLFVLTDGNFVERSIVFDA
jgi:desampylase